ncbi:MAG: helix-turn-helix domain-containing protein [Lachnospiraceae bacterium]|nr:helix-turn-helix domain-containing protein [Lachnospiraceae bacterium]
MTNFSKNLQALRKEKKVTQEQLAGHLGVSAQAVSKWENGNYPESDLLPAIADFFGVSIDFLYGRGGREKTIEEAVFDAARDCCDVEYQKTGSSEAHNDFARLIRNLQWAIQTGSWVNNTGFAEPPYDIKEYPKMASAVYDNVFFTYMGLREDNNFSLCIFSPDDKEVFEDLLRDTRGLTELFGLLSDRDNLAIITYLYSLKNGEFAGVDQVAHATGISRDKVRKSLEELIGSVGDPRVASPFRYVKVVSRDKQDPVYGVDPTLGGIFMGLMMIAREYTEPPMVYRMDINCRTKSWIDRKKLKEK